MYFYQGYSLHGTYWHTTTFGHPMSHGLCQYAHAPEAEWFLQKTLSMLATAYPRPTLKLGFQFKLNKKGPFAIERPFSFLSS